MLVKHPFSGGSHPSVDALGKELKLLEFIKRQEEAWQATESCLPPIRQEFLAFLIVVFFLTLYFQLTLFWNFGLRRAMSSLVLSRSTLMVLEKKNIW